MRHLRVANNSVKQNGEGAYCGSMERVVDQQSICGASALNILRVRIMVWRDVGPVVGE